MPSLAEVDEALAAGDFQAAFAALRFSLHYPQGLAEWRRLLGRFAQICDGIAGADLHDMIQRPDEKGAQHNPIFETAED